MKKLLFSSLLCLLALSMSAQQYVDLGLPSGTQWKNHNEHGYYTYEQAIATFGTNLPTKHQLAELINMCVWTWTGNGCSVVGPNGQTLFIPAMGYFLCNDGGFWGKDIEACYWSYTPATDANKACDMYICAPEGKFDGVIMTGEVERCRYISVRLVKLSH